MSDVYTDAVLRICRRSSMPVPLDMPPATARMDLICPHCSGIDGKRRQTEGVQVVECPECGTQFTGPREPKSKMIVRKLAEEKRRRCQFLLA